MSHQCKRLIAFNRFNICSVLYFVCALCTSSAIWEIKPLCVFGGLLKVLRGHWFSCETRPQFNGRLDLASACFLFCLEEKGEGNMKHRKVFRFLNH